MALPTKLKTWQHATNLNPGFNGTDMADSGQLFYLIKEALKGVALNPWTVDGSSDAVTAGMDAVDRVTDHTKVIRSGGAHTWMVLGQDGSGTNWQLLLDFQDGDFRDLYIWFSPTGAFTGGSTTARPTAADEITISFNPRFFISGAVTGGQGFSCRAHVMVSTDGLSTRFITCQGNTARFFLFVDQPQDPPTGWTNPVCMGAYGDDQAPPFDALSFYRWTINDNHVRAQGPMGVMYMNMTMQGFATNGNSNGVFLGREPWANPDESSGQYPLSGVGVAHSTTVGQRGRHGYLSDFYFTALSAPQGNSFPGDGSKSWVIFGNMVLPWDGGDIEMG